MTRKSVLRLTFVFTCLPALLICAFFSYVAINLFRTVPFDEYKPEFKVSGIELVEGTDQSGIFFKLNSGETPEDVLKDYTIIHVFDNYPSIVDKNISKKTTNYFVVNMKQVNLDCIGVYKGREIEKNIFFRSLSNFPNPSDSWTCKGFDFNNALKYMNRYETAGVKNAYYFEKFFRLLQQAVEKNDKAEVARLFAYPMNINFNGKLLPVNDVNDFLQVYGDLFNEKVRNAVINQNPTYFWYSNLGLRIGEGEITIKPKIIENEQYSENEFIIGEIRN